MSTHDDLPDTIWQLENRIETLTNRLWWADKETRAKLGSRIKAARKKLQRLQIKQRVDA